VTSDLSGPLLGESVTLTAAVAYDAAYPTSLRSSAFRYTFEFGDGAELILTGPGSVSTTRSYQFDGTYTVKVTVRETSGAAVSKILEVGRLVLTVNPALPIQGTINLGPTPSLVTGSPVSFTATGSGGGPPYIFTWSFGDGSTGSGESVSHTYTVTGTYTVTLTVTDRRGIQQTSTRTLELSAPPSADQTLLLLGGGVAVAAAAGLVFFVRRRGSRTVSPRPK
jgi:PKD repeat protein